MEGCWPLGAAIKTAVLWLFSYGDSRLYCTKYDQLNAFEPHFGETKPMGQTIATEHRIQFQIRFRFRNRGKSEFLVNSDRGKNRHHGFRELRFSPESTILSDFFRSVTNILVVVMIVLSSLESVI